MGKREFSRDQRLGDQIHRDLALLIEKRVSDPRIQDITLTAVRVSRDLSHARVYYTTLGDDRDSIKAALDKAAPYLRHLLAEGLLTRITPRLSFVFDESIERGRNMEALIRAAVRPSADAEADSDTDSTRDPDA